MYQLKLVASRLKKGKIAYFMTAIQIFIGILIVGFTLNIYINVNKEYDEFLKSQKDKEYLITHNKLDDPSIAITEETLNNILDINANANIFANYEFNFITFAGTVRKVVSSNILLIALLNYIDKKSNIKENRKLLLIVYGLNNI